MVNCPIVPFKRGIKTKMNRMEYKFESCRDVINVNSNVVVSRNNLSNHMELVMVYRKKYIIIPSIIHFKNGVTPLLVDHLANLCIWLTTTKKALSNKRLFGFSCGCPLKMKKEGSLVPSSFTVSPVVWSIESLPEWRLHTRLTLL
jgi:hypothetical protein